MSKDTVTIKEMSTELNVPVKEIMQTMRNMGMEAKGGATPIASEHIERVRNHFKSADASEGAAGGNIKVRRRKSPDTSSKTAVDPVKGTQKTEASATPTDNATPVKKSGKSRRGSGRSARALDVPQARIISPPQAPTPVAATQPTNTVSDTPLTPAVEVLAEKASVDTLTAKNTVSTPPTTATIVATATTDTVASEQNTAPESTSTADAVHHMTPDASAMPEGSSTPTLSSKTADIAHNEAHENSEKATEKTEPAQEEGRNKRRERNNKKRPAVQATPQVRIISRPSPSEVQQRTENRVADNRSHDGRGGRPPRPAQGGQGGQGTQEGQNQRGYNQGGRDAAGGGRPPRPSGQNAGAPNNRPPRSGAPMTPGFGAPETPGEGQSKKKRMKGRRTVDFQQGGDFNRFGNEDEGALRIGRSSKGRRKGKDKRHVSTTTTQPLKAAKRKIRVTESIRVADMAHQMGLKVNEIIKVLFNLGVMATINQALDIETATLVAAEFEYEVEKAGFSEDDYLIPTENDTPESLRPRPPVVTIMGHVDHGKTSLLDAIRKSNVTGGEAGGITQHIGAYHVTTKRGEIVFLDTPGHEAFTAMRARGAQVTDLVILVVAADDGVMEQTREAINHSKAANVPIMVAVNKMDKPGAEPDRVLRELAELGLQAESWGGDTVTALVSAKSREGLDELLELVALQAELLELKANPDKFARGRIVEAKLDKGRGPVATVLIQEGTLHQGDTFVCGVFSGRVRALFNDQGKKVKEAGPAIPVEVQGFEGVPEAGEEFVCVADEKLARRIAETRATKQRERYLAKESKVTLETFLSRRASDQEALTLNLVLKADVQGSLEAITEALVKMSTDKVRINVVHGGAGAISESDILLASASQAIIIGFNVRPTAKIKEVAEQENVDIRFYDIIYKLGDDIKQAMQGMLAPVQREQYLGQAEVRQIFSVPKVGVIAGCYVNDGKMNRNAGVRLLRDGVVVYTGKVGSLKRMKDDAREVLKGYECGIGLENFNDIKVNDVIEAFEMIEEAATL